MKRILKLLSRIWLQNMNFEILRSYYTSLSRQIVRNPRLFILWPISIVFILSYPALYSIYTSNTQIFQPYVSDFKNVEIVHTHSFTYDPRLAEGIDLAVRQIWLQKSFVGSQDMLEPSDSSALEKEFLLEALDLQQTLLRGITLSSGADHTGSALLHSPLQLWGNSAPAIKDDRILKTLHSATAKSSAGLTLTHPTIFSGTVKVNSLLKSADALLISLVYVPDKDHPETDAGSIWDANLSNLQKNDSSSPFLVFAKDPTQAHYQEFLFKFSSMRWPDTLLLVVSYACLAVCFALSLLNIHSVKSRAGLLGAFVVEMALSILAAASATSYIFQEVDFFHIPLQVLPFVVIVVGMENMLGLVNTVSSLPEELSMSRKLSRSLSTRGLSSSLIVAADLAILLLLVPFVGTSTVQFCIFAAIALSIDHFLHLTYFAAVLSVDIRRLELEDLLHFNNNTSEKESSSGVLPSYGSSASSRRRAPWSRLVSRFLGDPSILPSHGDLYHNKKLSLQSRFGQKLLKVKFPITTTAAGSVSLILFLVFANLRWIHNGDQASLHAKAAPFDQDSLAPAAATPSPLVLSSQEYDISLVNPDTFNFFLNRKTSAVEISQFYQNVLHLEANASNDFALRILVQEPTVMIHKSAFNEIEYKKIKAYNAGNPKRKIEFKDPEVKVLSNTVHRFDIHYLAEFLTSLVFVCSALGVALKVFIKDDEYQSTSADDSDSLENSKAAANAKTRFNCKDLVNGHFLDIIRISTSANPFVVSVGMDHKIFVWSPITTPIPIPTELPLPRQLWPVTNVVMADPGNLIAVFSKSGTIKCWSRLSMSWCWTVNIEGLRSGQFLEAYFRKKTAPAAISRKRGTKSRLGALTEGGGKSSPMKSRKSSRRSRLNDGDDAPVSAAAGLTRTMSIDSTFDRSNDLKALQENQNYDFIVVLKNGKMYTISTEDGSKREEVLSPVRLITADMMISPRVNDRLVCNTETGRLVIATAINNKWKVRSIDVQEKYNSGKSLLTPLAISRSSSFTNASALQHQQQFRANLNQLNPHQPHRSSRLSESYNTDDDDLELAKKAEIASFVGTEIAVVSFVGMIVRTRGLIAELIDAQTGTLLRRFNIGQFKPGTFRVFHSTPVHCRFCGSASVSSFSICYTEIDTSTLILQTFSINNRAKNNICLRVERDPRETRCLGFDNVTETQHWLENVEGWCVTDLNSILGIRKKHVADSEDDDSGDSKYHGAYSSSSSSYKAGNSGPYSRHSRNKSSADREQYHIKNIWEGFSLNANGKLVYHEIPNTSNDGLLVKNIGPVAKFGHKSIVVSFGNILKVLYTGGSNLFDADIDTDNGGGVSRLGFINRRKRMNVMSYQMTHSTDFGSIDDDDDDLFRESVGCLDQLFVGGSGSHGQPGKVTTIVTERLVGAHLWSDNDVDTVLYTFEHQLVHEVLVAGDFVGSKVQDDDGEHARGRIDYGDAVLLVGIRTVQGIQHEISSQDVRLSQLDQPVDPAVVAPKMADRVVDQRAGHSRWRTSAYATEQGNGMDEVLVGNDETQSQTWSKHLGEGLHTQDSALVVYFQVRSAQAVHVALTCHVFYVHGTGLDIQVRW